MGELYMNSLEFTTFINTIANAIACNASPEQLDLLAVTFTQLGDTLATISVTKNLCLNKKTVSHGNTV
jgi:hypothetical protein